MFTSLFHLPRCFVLGFILLASGLLTAPFLSAASTIEHHRILWMENPAHEAVVSWTTRTPGKMHSVYFDTVSRRGELGEYASHTPTFSDGKFTMLPVDKEWSQPGYYHHVHLQNLEPATTYFLVMVSDEAISQEFHFITAPDQAGPIKMLFGGDSRIGGSEPYDHNDRRNMNLRIAALVEEHPEILALAHGGDYCMRAEWRYLDRWLSDHELVTTQDGRLLPIIPARGNHDRQIGFEEMFTWPEREREYYYDIQISPDVALVVLNTEISLAGDQRDWAAETLEKLRPETRWLFVSYHRPSYPSVRNMQDGAPRRDNWVPLFERFDVDLVCESHDHALKRTLPIRSHAPDPKNGIIYIGDGGLGVPQRTPDTSRWWLQEPGFARPTHHVHLLEFGETLRVRAIGMEAESLDDFVVTSKQVKVP